jgi:hypothetical protein
MSAAQQPPERVAYETLRGTIETADVVETKLIIEHCRLKRLYRVETGDAGRWLEREEIVATDPDRRRDAV